MADLPKKINLTIVTRERKIIDVQVDEVVLPGVDGELGILPGHTPLLAMLRIGAMRYRVGNHFERLVLAWGFAEVLPDRVIVLAERGILPGEIDAAASEEERRRAERELADLSSHDPEFAIVEARLEESIAKISLQRGF
ncbi:MAG TPA: ATP synthase F1 subunit epsilon [Thermoanaerobaculia bacterium]|nr:ATP synthase F1 subunit epsilon [Thermoanaerobaculia bacterium]